MKVVINTCYGGFGISNQCAALMGAEVFDTCIPWRYNAYHTWEDDKDDEDFRTDERLIALIEEKGSEWCSDIHAQLKVVEIPDDIEWEIDEYDGMETIEEVHRSWS